MQIIKASEFVSLRGANSKPLLNLTGGTIGMSETTAKLIGGENFEKDEKDRDCFQVVFAVDNDTDKQLFLKVVPAGTEESIRLTFQSNKRFEYTNKTLANYLRGFTGSEKLTVPCLIQEQAKTAEGWIPLITTYWKTLEH